MQVVRVSPHQAELSFFTESAQRTAFCAASFYSLQAVYKTSGTLIMKGDEPVQAIAEFCGYCCVLSKHD